MPFLRHEEFAGVVYGVWIGYLWANPALSKVTRIALVYKWALLNERSR